MDNLPQVAVIKSQQQTKGFPRNAKIENLGIGLILRMIDVLL
jgi:hypothetical protein